MKQRTGEQRTEEQSFWRGDKKYCRGHISKERMSAETHEQRPREQMTGYKSRGRKSTGHLAEQRLREQMTGYKSRGRKSTGHLAEQRLREQMTGYKSRGRKSTGHLAEQRPREQMTGYKSRGRMSTGHLSRGYESRAHATRTEFIRVEDWESIPGLLKSLKILSLAASHSGIVTRCGSVCVWEMCERVKLSLCDGWIVSVRPPPPPPPTLLSVDHRLSYNHNSQ